jgi:hypothetical protein
VAPPARDGVIVSTLAWQTGWRPGYWVRAATILSINRLVEKPSRRGINTT